MCTSCVDRLFTSGPAPCPVAGCHKTLRKRGFHAAFFADLGIEREVDVRKRVGTVFNRREEEFDTLRDWNDYLESVEDLVFRLTEGTPAEKKEAEAALMEYKEANQRMIEENEKAEKEEEDMARRAQAQQEERARRRREQARQREAEEKEEIRKAKSQALDKLASGDGNAADITRRAEQLIQQKTERMKREHLDEERQDRGITIRGNLKKRKAKELDMPYDAFGGLDLTPTRYVLQKSYKNEWLKGVTQDPGHMVGGYSLQAYYARSMLDAFAGLGVFIQDEKSAEPEMLHTTVTTGSGGDYEDGF